MPATAQIIDLSQGTGFLTGINGSLGANDVDMYMFIIYDLIYFYAHVSTTGDSQLFLFRLDGTGVIHNDNRTEVPVIDPRAYIGAGKPSPSGVYSGNTLIASWSEWAAGNLPPGYYLLAISGADRDPESAGGFIWLDIPDNLQRIPDGPGAASIITGWSDTGLELGSYTILLGGAAPTPEPSTFLLLSLGLLALRDGGIGSCPLAEG